MTVEAFARAIATIRRRHGGWETSAGRSDAHSIAVKGFAGDPHTWDLGRDMAYEHFPPLAALEAEAAALGLKVIRESNATGVTHDHYQPLDFPAGPVTEYAGERKTWT